MNSFIDFEHTIFGVVETRFIGVVESKPSDFSILEPSFVFNIIVLFPKSV